MCDFCHQHGEGKVWYLKASNYAEDLLSDIKRRNFIMEFFAHPEHLSRSLQGLERLETLPSFVKSVVTPVSINRQKKVHYGQVVPIEEVEKIFEFVNSVVRLPCICRQASLGTEQRYCYGLSMVGEKESEMNRLIRSIDAGYINGPQASGLEELSNEQALKNFRDMEKSGLCHSVWTFITPFIGGICNCDRSDCMAMRATIGHSHPVMFKGEYVAMVQTDLCNGCRACMRNCQFGAMGYSASLDKVFIDPAKCYGCGVCRAACARNAIILNVRNGSVAEPLEIGVRTGS